MNRSEHEEQVLFFKIVYAHICKIPELMAMYATPNAGKRSITAAQYMKLEGMKSGVPDICLPLPVGEFGALYIEMKTEKGGVLSENQKFWLNLLNDCGNMAVCCRGHKEAEKVFFDYINESNGINNYIIRYKLDAQKAGKKSGLSKEYYRVALIKGYFA